jgi:hypothetical protein
MEVLAIQDMTLETTRRIESVCEVASDSGVPRLPVLSLAVGVNINCSNVADGVE